MAVMNRVPLSNWPIRRENGTKGDGAIVNVYLPGTTTPATIWTSRTGTGTGTNPVTADSRGLLPNWVTINSDGLDMVVAIDGVTYSAQRIYPASATGTQTKRVTTGSVAASSNATVTVTWDVSFIDANYTVAMSMFDATAVGTNALFLDRIITQTATEITVRVRNADSGAAHTGTIHASAIHD